MTLCCKKPEINSEASCICDNGDAGVGLFGGCPRGAEYDDYCGHNSRQMTLCCKKPEINSEASCILITEIQVLLCLVDDIIVHRGPFCCKKPEINSEASCICDNGDAGVALFGRCPRGAEYDDYCGHNSPPMTLCCKKF